MSKISDILNLITELVAPSGIVFTGYFNMPSNNIFFIGRVKLEDYQKLVREKNATFNLFGNVCGKNIFIKNASIVRSSCHGVRPEYISVDILPYEIAVGVSCDETPIMVERIETVMPELNWFFGNSVVSPTFDSKADNFPAKFNPLNITVNYEDKKLSILRTFRACETWKGLAFKNINQIEIGFTISVPIMEAIRQVTSVRLFFCFLADDYVELPSEFCFSTSTSQTLDENESQLADKYLWLNDNHSYHIVKKDYPFRIYYSMVKDCFADVWHGWTFFWDNPLNLPMIELFSEIVTNKSVGLNRFLNLCQALEVYSTQFRNSEAKAVWKTNKNNSENINNKNSPKFPTLCHRFTELFTYHCDIFPRREAEIAEISKNIADIRNYYTHYNPKSRTKLENQYDDISIVHSRYEGVLHFMLLATVYKAIGIPIDAIKNAMFNVDSRFGVSTERLFEGPNKDELPY